jgi:anti-anti-sigma factor
MSDTVSFAVTAAWTGTDVVLVVAGELDLAASAAWDASVGEAMGQVPSAVAVDLAATTFVDSSGLRLLLMLRQRVADAGATFTVTNISPAVARLLEVTGLTDLVGGSE